MTKIRIALIVTAIALALSAVLRLRSSRRNRCAGAAHAVPSCSRSLTGRISPILRGLTPRGTCVRSDTCSEHPLALAPEGGLVNIPRNLNKNFKAWREGPNVLICPTDRAPTRPIYQFVFEDDRWRFRRPGRRSCCPRAKSFAQARAGHRAGARARIEPSTDQGSLSR